MLLHADWHQAVHGMDMRHDIYTCSINGALLLVKQCLQAAADRGNSTTLEWEVCEQELSARVCWAVWC